MTGRIVVGAGHSGIVDVASVCGQPVAVSTSVFVNRQIPRATVEQGFQANAKPGTGMTLPTLAAASNQISEAIMPSPKADDCHAPGISECPR